MEKLTTLEKKILKKGYIVYLNIWTKTNLFINSYPCHNNSKIILNFVINLNKQKLIVLNLKKCTLLI